MRIRAQVQGGPSLGPLGSPLEVPVRVGQSLAYHVEVIGPGGVVLARLGTAEAPIRWSYGQQPQEVGGGVPTAPDAPPSDDSALWIGLGIGAAALVVIAAVVITAVLVTSSQGVSDQTRPRLPVLAAFD